MEPGRRRRRQGDGAREMEMETRRWSQKEGEGASKGLKVTVGVKAPHGAEWLDPHRCSSQSKQVAH